MSENERIPAAPAGADGASMTAGQMLRAARERSGMQLAALAAAIKVPPQKLEALETDRLEALPDATFARALAKTVCRFLKVDPEPVLARLPDVRMSELEHVAQGLNQPFRDTAQRQDLFKVESLRRPVVLVSLLLVIAALVLWALPPGMLGFSDDTPEPTTQVEPVSPGAPSTESETAPVVPPPFEPAAPAAEPAVPAPQPAVPPPAAVPAVPPAATTPPAAAPAPAPASATGAAETGPAGKLASAVILRTLAPSWIELRDADGKTLLSRQLAGGETASLDGRFPMQLKVGNAGGTELTVRGQPVDLKAHTRNNVARLELQ